MSVCYVLYKSVASCTLIRCAPSFPFGLFSHHSNRGNSLQDYPSFAGETVGTRIDRDNSLVMPPSFVRQLRNNTAQSDGTVRQARRSYSRRRCGSCSVFEVAHYVNKYTLNECSFGCGCPTHVIPREQSDRGNLSVRRTINRHIPFISTP